MILLKSIPSRRRQRKPCRREVFGAPSGWPPEVRLHNYLRNGSGSGDLQFFCGRAQVGLQEYLVPDQK